MSTRDYPRDYPREIAAAIGAGDVAGLGALAMELLQHAAAAEALEQEVLARRRAELARAQRRRDAGPITAAARAFVLARDGHRCAHCGATERLAMDHVIPVSRGGRSHPANLQPLCTSCNSRKGARMPA